MLNPLQMIVTKRNNTDKATIECRHMIYGSATVIWKFFRRCLCVFCIHVSFVWRNSLWHYKQK